MTNLLYLSDTYQETATATLLDIRDHEKGTALILDQTIFYPQGGGQPCDQGIIKSGDNIFKVEYVALDADGEVWHIGKWSANPGSSEPGLNTKERITGKTVNLQIDMERRMTNTRYHSAGHLIDIALRDGGAMHDLVADKGFHYPEGAYNQYEGLIENPSQYIENLEQRCQAIIDQDIPIIAQDLSPQEAAQRGIKSPPGKAARLVYFEGYENEGCGCGGTHTKTTGEIGTITIRKISSKKGVTRVAYLVD